MESSRVFQVPSNGFWASANVGTNSTSASIFFMSVSRIVGDSTPVARARTLPSAQLVVRHQPQIVFMLVAGALLRDMPITRAQLESFKSRDHRSPLQVNIVLGLCVLTDHVRSGAVHP